ncbi:pas domain s-box protein [Stylonychia lemnae]|uniref:Pas domain s-box protein n=1 Tax=Stylonychia lemnae TaxID=5949 RepID=A0A078A270_STYLE|nr:pas domain s-box protein [Stylonychia lemnae]|eukprot:CDW74854.1 pas domain s-box protein [Stylonychia lemnae]
MISTGLVTLLYYALIIKCCDYYSSVYLMSVVLMMAYSCYFYEKKLKLEFIQFYQIQKMNVDLKMIFDSLPEGIILFDPTNNKVSLANQEYRRLFNIPSVEINEEQEATSENRYLLEQCYQIQDNNNTAINNNQIGDVSKSNCMIMVKNLTPIINYEKVKQENHFYEMLTATVSHDMRTPLNIMSGLLESLDGFVFNPTGIGAKEKGIQVIYNCSRNFPQLLHVDEQRIKQVLLNLLQNSLKFTFQGNIEVQVNYDHQLMQTEISVTDTGIGIKPEDHHKLFSLFGKLDATASINTTGIGLGLSICQKIISMLNGKIQIDPSYTSGCRISFTIYADIQEQSRNDAIASSQMIFITRSNYNSAIDFLPVQADIMRETSQLTLEINKEGLEKYSDANVSDTLNVTTQNDYKVNIPISEGINLIFPNEKSFCTCQQLKDILVVDDNIFNLITIQAMLELELKQKVDRAANGLEALQLVQQRFNHRHSRICSYQHTQNLSYKLIFMDSNMPVMDGFQASMSIREFERINSINKSKIVALTAYSTEMFSNKCLDSGMDDFLTKPISILTLRNIIENLDYPFHHNP